MSSSEDGLEGSSAVYELLWGWTRTTQWVTTTLRLLHGQSRGCDARISIGYLRRAPFYECQPKIMPSGMHNAI